MKGYKRSFSANKVKDSEIEILKLFDITQSLRQVQDDVIVSSG